MALQRWRLALLPRTVISQIRLIIDGVCTVFALQPFVLTSLCDTFAPSSLMLAKVFRAMAEIRKLRTGGSGEPPSRSAPRRLAAIVAGDIAGYTRLMEIDEEGTHGRVMRIERDLIEPTIAEHNGTLVKTTGDGFMAMFDSPLEAVKCGIVIQQNMIGRNASYQKHLWIEYRIGINLGDVIIEPHDIYGDGVNIAVRLEGIAERGQVYISGGIYEQIKNKLVCGYESLGDRKVKNITDPVRVYRVLSDPAAFNLNRKRREMILSVMLGATMLVIAAGGGWYFLRPAEKQQAAISIATTPIASSTPSALPVPTPLAEATATATALPSVPSVRTVPESTPKKPPASSVREPEMTTLSGATFAMGSNDDPSEKPVHQVIIKSFAIGKFPITIREWNECAAEKLCSFEATGSDDAPITNVSWSDAKQYVAWLANATRKPYRLPSEAEWEYAARGDTQTRYWWGDQSRPGMANCKDCGGSMGSQPTKVGTAKPNPFGLFDMGGGVDQWVEDCWHKNYQGAPSDGSPWLETDCTSHVLRSGSWRNDVRYVRPSNRDNYDTNVRYPTHGFRVALTL